MQIEGGRKKRKCNSNEIGRKNEGRPCVRKVAREVRDRESKVRELGADKSER